MALEYVGSNPTETNILDYGCGRGWLSDQLRSFGNAHGIDLSEQAIEGAKELYPGVLFASADLSKVEIQEVFPNKRFDILVSSEVIEHVLDQDDFLKNAYKALSPGGSLILTTPNGRFKKAYFDGPRKDWGQPYEFWLTPDQLVDLCQKAGFEIALHRAFNPRWLLNLRIYQWNSLKFFENRLIRSLRFRLGLDEAYLKLLRRFDLGLYQILIAKKPT